MGSILYILAVILIIGWLVGFFAFHAGGIIHILLVIAVIALVIRPVQGRSAWRAIGATKKLRVNDSSLRCCLAKLLRRNQL